MASETLTPEKKRALTTVIAASSVGTLIEWYDFYIFGSLATVIGLNFFPKDNPTAGFLSTLAVFATGFIVRPFGAVVFGWIGDKVGRKHTFLVTLLMMGGSTFLVGCLPTYAQVGVLAPALLLILRLVQGLALGGEYGGAATYVAEYAPTDRRGYFTSFIQTTATLGLLVSLGVILAVQTNQPKEAFESFGWRIPFLISSLLVFFSYFIRKKLAESPLYLEMKSQGKTSKNPIKESFGNKKNLVLVLTVLFGATAGQGVVWYTGQFHAMNFMEKSLGIPSVDTKIIIAIVLFIATPLFVFFGHLSDKIGRKKIMMAGCLLAAIAYFPIFSAMVGASGTDMLAKVPVPHDPNYFLLGLLVFIQVVFVTMVYGPIAAFLVELFPTKIRYTSMSLPYHIGNGVFGGLVPFIATWAGEATGNKLAGLWYPVGVAAMTFVIGSIFIKERLHQPLDEVE